MEDLHILLNYQDVYKSYPSFDSVYAHCRNLYNLWLRSMRRLFLCAEALDHVCNRVFPFLATLHDFSHDVALRRGWSWLANAQSSASFPLTLLS